MRNYDHFLNLYEYTVFSFENTRGYVGIECRGRMFLVTSKLLSDPASIRLYLKTFFENEA